MSGADRTRLLAYGDCGVLVEAPDLAGAMRAGAVLRAAHAGDGLDGVVDVVPAARSVLVVAAAPGSRDGVAAAVRRVLAQAGGTSVPPDAGREVRITVRYDGDDLEAVGELTALGADGVVAAHRRAVWTVAFAGFAPGFAYLVDADAGEDGPLVVPRRDEPRTRVPSGAVGLAGPFSGVYPRDSPGGWQLIASTREALWDLGRDPAALLQPGDRVRFVTEDGS